MTAVYHYDLDQNSEDWLKVRLGRPTASVAATICAKGGTKGGVSKTRQKLLWRLAGEMLTGEPEDSYRNEHMDRGHDQESDAAMMYRLATGNETAPIGFVVNGRAGASPDLLVGSDGLWEGKSAIGSVQIERLLMAEKDKAWVPPEYVLQMQMQLWVCEREWVDFTSYNPGLPPLIRRVKRNETKITELRSAVDAFCEELDALVTKIEGM